MMKISNGYLPLVFVLCLFLTQSAFATMSWMLTDIRPLANGSLYEQEPRFNSDGTLVAYRGLYAPHSAENSDIWVVALDGFNGTPVVTESVGEIGPSFKPDGRITYARRDPPGSDDIWVLDKNGYDRHLLIDGPLEQMNPYWRPSGDRLAYTNEYEDGRGQIYRAEVVTDVPLTVNPIGPVTGPDDGYSQSMPIYSRAGDRIAFTGYETAGGTAKVYVVPESRTPGELPLDPIADGGPAFWLPDDSRLGYVTTSGEVRLYNFGTGEHELLVIDSDPTYPWDPIFAPDLSPDGKWLVFQGMDGHLWVGELIPEPCTIALLGIGGLSVLRRRRKE